ncbi:MAG TPA: tetratricopeptide repeat protein [Desulfuromonadales bacterium]|nr:tetratricopeptide repeat protein [Desulfuromonadales bacterium]
MPAASYAHNSDFHPFSDFELFKEGILAYQQHVWELTSSYMTTLLESHPRSRLREMALFWLAQSLFKSGNRSDAARCLAQFIKESPDRIDLHGDVDAELLNLSRRCGRSTTTTTLPDTLFRKPARNKPRGQHATTKGVQS